jgi:hypothetical protein
VTPEEVAQRLLRIDLLKRALKAEETKLREAGAEWKPGTRVVGEYNNLRLGTVSRTKDSTTWIVADEDALFEWVLEHHPDELIDLPEEVKITPARTVVNPKFVGALLEEAENKGGLFDPETGEPLDFITSKTKRGHLLPTPDPEMKKAIMEGLDFAKRLEINP